MTNPRTATSFALLSLLRLRSWTTYELAKQARRSLNWFWPRAERKLYDEPKRLVADGLATATSETTGRRPRTVYAITDDGRAALRDWLGQPSSPRAAEFEAMVKVFFADAGSKDQLVANLTHIHDETTERIEELASLTDSTLLAPPFPQRMHLSALTVRLQLEQELAIQAWAGWALTEVRDWIDADDPGDWDSRAVLRSAVDDARTRRDAVSIRTHDSADRSTPAVR